MKSYQDILQQIQIYHELGETVQAAQFVVAEYDLIHPNLKGFELREKAKADYILMTTEGYFGEKQIIRIPENTFEFEFVLMLNLLAHEMVHVGQKAAGINMPDRNEREWLAYYEMLFHTCYPKVPNAQHHQLQFFASKGLEYYKRMGEGSILQQKYAIQKQEVDNLVALLQ